MAGPLESIHTAESKGESSLSFAFQVILGSLFLAVAAQVRIPLPFTPVPLTLQTLAVMLVGTFLGREKGLLSVMLYLAEIGIGLPVLPAGEANVLALLGPKGGYYAGFLIQSYLCSIARDQVMHKWQQLALLTLSALATLTIGTLWLGSFVGYANAPMLGFLPFIPGEALKVLFMASLIKRLP